MGFAVLALAMVGTLQLYDVAASEGWLGADAQAKYLQQSGALGVLVGGRSEVLVSSQAVIDSPILGQRIPGPRTSPSRGSSWLIALAPWAMR